MRKKVKQVLIKMGLLKDISKIENEAMYYRKLFIENPKWNTSFPNEEEAKRWEIIKRFIFFIHLYYKSNSIFYKLEILDVGCGRGWMCNLLSEYGNVLGIEPVSSVAKYAKDLFPHLSIREATPSKLLRENKKFELIICSEVIEHIPHNEQINFMDDLKSLLTPFGFIIITTPRKEAQEQWLKYSIPNQPIEDWLSENEIASIMKSLHFQHHLLEKFSITPHKDAPSIEIYQLWLFQKL